MYNNNNCYIRDCIKRYADYIEAPKKAVKNPPKRPEECKINEELNDIYDFIDSFYSDKSDNNNKIEKNEMIQEEYEKELKRLYEEFSKLPDDIF